MVWLRWRRLACPASTSYLPRALPPLSSAPRPPTIFGEVRATSLALCGETHPRTRVKTPHPRPCAERRTPRTRLSTPHLRPCAERRPPYPPQYATSAACAESRTAVPAARLL